jgi:hypothetical protein
LAVPVPVPVAVAVAVTFALKFSVNGKIVIGHSSFERKE